MTAHPMDSNIYGHLWGTPEARGLFDDRGRTQAWLNILAALAEAQAEVGLVPPEAAKQIRLHAHVSMLDLDELAIQTRETGHSTLGLIRCVQHVLPQEAREWVYYGATVQDVSDTWTALVMQRITAIADRDLARIEAAATRLSREHANTIMSGRTHGQAGLPVTFGFKAAVWVSEIRRHRERLAEGSRRWSVVQLGGAIGTMEFWGDRALPLLDAFARRLDLQAPDIAWLTARDRVAEFISVLGMITATLGKIGQEVYQLQRPELAEVREGATPGVVGSITMPHKVNPEISEHLVTLARVVRSHVGLAFEGMLPEHERDGRAWKTEWLVLPEACCLTAATLTMAHTLLERLEVDPSRMADNLAARGGYVLSEPVMRELAPRLGKHHAHELIYQTAMRGLAEGLTFRDALLSEPAVGRAISEEELSAALAPTAGLGSAPEFVTRVVGSNGAQP
ncbi:class-II fumarase/aspartase family protein [Nocardioides pocheonensis]|uniref:Adenylosuccinate lyase family protein n=1 Tax=Nocardioides pocheonensis TaxID=661485 RepID=A0A3N0GJ67_9ACTN|nr:adenylosuccinate lyase family protein [Nocardioides pocheonensis]RNM12212.1 adenylosuccinate lyase family protein [Nocardioides pocheonensis]